MMLAAWLTLAVAGLLAEVQGYLKIGAVLLGVALIVAVWRKRS